MHLCCARCYTEAIVHTKIAEFFCSRKGKDTVLLGAVLLLGVAAFSLGRLSVASDPAAPVVLYVPKETAAREPVQREAPVASPSATTGSYVASKNGSVYHLPWCSGAQRIKEANKVWYETKEAAEAAGLRPAANCKGI